MRGLLLDHGSPNRMNWRSLASDVRWSRSAVGPRVASRIGEQWNALAAAMDLPRVHESARGAKRVLALSSELLKILSDPCTREAAWDDVTEAHRADQLPEISEARIRLLADVMRLAGHDWAFASETLAGGINDNLIDLAEMGHPIPGDVEIKTLHDPAGLELDTRLRLCRAYVAREPWTGSLAAWVAFERAFLPEQYCRIGPVELWDGATYPDGVIHGWWSDGVPPEVPAVGRTTYLPLNVEKPWVLVRVDLGERVVAGAGESARALARTLIAVARSSSGWRLMDGVGLVREGRWFGRPIRPVRPPTERFSPNNDPSGSHVRRMNPTLVNDLVSNEPAVRDVVADVEWQQLLANVVDPAQRAALSVRLLERRVPETPTRANGRGGGWAANVRWWMRDLWVRERLLAELDDVAYEGVYGTHQLDPEGRPLADKYSELVRRSASALGFHIDRRAILSQLPSLAQDLPEYGMSRRIVRWMAEETADASRLRAHLDDLGDCFDRLLARAQRVRNAVLHGNDTPCEVVESVEPFLSYVCRVIVIEQLYALEHGKPLRQTLGEAREASLQAISRLRAGDSPVSALFDD